MDFDDMITTAITVCDPDGGDDDYAIWRVPGDHQADLAPLVAAWAGDAEIHMHVTYPSDPTDPGGDPLDLAVARQLLSGAICPWTLDPR